MAYSDYKWDVFICHATEDKVAIADPLHDRLRYHGLNVWYDKHSIYAGQNIFKKVSEGLKGSMLVVAIISDASLAKKFPTYEIGSVILNPNGEPDRLIPLYFNISPSDNESSPIGFPNFPLWLEVKDGEYFRDKLNEATEKIIGRVQITKADIEEREKINQKKREKKIFRGVILSLLSVIIIYFLYRLLPDKLNPPPVINNNYYTTPAEKKIIDAPKNSKPHEDNIRPKPGEKKNETDYTTYVNAASISSTGKADVSVIILGDDGNILPSLTSSIVDIYSKSGKKVNMGLLKSSFTQNCEFQNLVAGNSDIIDKLKLSDYTNYLVVGKINYTISSGSLTNGTIVCNASLTINVISTITKSIYKSFDIPPTNGNDVTQSAAKERALQKLLMIYEDQYSTI